jgi:hypothetical protein
MGRVLTCIVTMAAVVVVGAVTCGDVAGGQADDKLGNKQKFSESPIKNAV